MKISTHIILVPMLGISVAILPFPSTPSCRVEEKKLRTFYYSRKFKTLDFPQYKDINCFRQTALSFPMRRTNISKVSLLAKCAGPKCLMDQSIRKGTFDAQ
jgi:hypothetical protein